jgi:autotransporter-associated beta strand protein
VTVGSIDGAGDILLGSKNLGLGVNDTDMTLSGVIWDGGLSGGVSGSLTKLGLGTLTLDGDNNFTGGTTLVDGRLVVGSTRALGRGDATLVGGELSAGAGHHLIFVEGDYLQTAPATLALGLGGTLAEDFDRLLANGSVSLDGTLAVSNGTFANGFRPLIGDGFYVARRRAT